MKKLIWIVSLLACGLANAQYIDLNIQGQKFVNNLEVTASETTFYNLPLPSADEWVTVRSHEDTSTLRNGSSYRMRGTELANIKNKQLMMAMYVNAKIDDTTVRWLDEPCKGEDFIYKNDYGMKLWDQRCLTIKLSSYNQRLDNKFQTKSREYFSQNGIKHDFNCLSVVLSQYTRSGKFLTVSFYVFPSQYGLENPLAEVLASHPWYLSNYKNDPAKLKFIEQLTAWAESYSNVLYKGFNEGKRQIVDVPAFAYVK